jgi:hypothetical protein
MLRRIFLALSIAVCLAAQAAAEPVGLTFFGWSDQHVQTNGDGKHLLPAIEAMNALPGTPYPEKIGGKVEKPAFVFGCGDITEWPTAAARDSYEAMLKRLKYPAFDIPGNHDEGGKSPSETIKRWLVARHGGLPYTFDRGGVHFVALFSKYDESLDNPAQPIHRDALAFVREDLKKLPPGKPVIVAMHLCLEAITNRDELVSALGEANVLAVLGGHYHKSTVESYRKIPFVQFPSPAANGPGEVMVVRITEQRIVALPYSYRNKKWNDDPKKMLDVPIRLAAKKAE